MTTMSLKNSDYNGPIGPNMDHLYRMNPKNLDIQGSVVYNVRR